MPQCSVLTAYLKLNYCCFTVVISAFLKQFEVTLLDRKVFFGEPTLGKCCNIL